MGSWKRWGDNYNNPTPCNPWATFSILTHRLRRDTMRPALTGMQVSLMSEVTIPTDYSGLDSLVSIYGTVQAVDQRCLNKDESPGAGDKFGDADRCECRFSIVNANGRFSVRAIWSSQQCERLQASQVQVIGRLQSCFFRQCHQHHHEIEALVVIILTPDSEGRDRVLSILQSDQFTPEGNQWRSG